MFSVARPFLVMSCCLIVLLSAENVAGQSSRDRKKLEQEKLKIESEIKGLKKMLDATSHDYSASVARFQILSNTVSKRQQLIENINASIVGLDGQITTLSREVQRLSKQYETLRKDYANMIRAAYVNRERYSKIMFLLASDDFNQAYLRLRYYQQYSEFRKRQVFHIEATQQELTARRVSLDSVRNHQIKSRKELNAEKARLVEEQSQQDQMVKKLASKKNTLQKDLKNKQLAAEKLKKAIEKIIAEEIRLAAERAKKTAAKSKTAPGRKAANPDVFELTPAETELAKNFSDNRGRLPWPVDRGYVVEAYGEHPHPVTRTVKTKNNGIDILSPANAAAKAVFEGVVSRVIEVPGYNHVVIIRHGSFLSVYSNLATVSVKEGAKVAVGTVIGLIAADSSGKNTMVHFEMWKGTTSVNPSDWLSRRP